MHSLSYAVMEDSHTTGVTDVLAFMEVALTDLLTHCGKLHFPCCAVPWRCGGPLQLSTNNLAVLNSPPSLRTTAANTKNASLQLGTMAVDSWTEK
jgi:hypothetical protein